MTDILKTLSGKSAFLLPWLFAALIAVGAGALFLVPAAQRDGLGTCVGNWSEATRGLVLAAVTIALGIVMSAASTPMYRLLEGYSWPKSLRDWGTGKQCERKKDLADKLEAAPPGTAEGDLLYEKLNRYPTNNSDLLPTRLGNALKAFELYGYEHFCLSSQVLWIELLGVVPKYVQDEVDNGRTACDFAVAATFLSWLYGLAALGLGVVGAFQRHFDVGAWVQVGALALWPLTYELAVISTDYWGQTVRALVNLGRKPLAAALGVPFPTDLQAERELWQAFSDFSYSPYTLDLANKLNAVIVKLQSTTLGSASAPSLATNSSAESAPPKTGRNCVLLVALQMLLVGGAVIELLRRKHIIGPRSRS